MRVVPKGSFVPKAPEPGQSALARARRAFGDAIPSLSAASAGSIPGDMVPSSISAPSPEASQPSESASELSADGHEDSDVSSVEETPKAAEPEKPKEDPLSAQYAALARKERAMREQAKAIKAQEEGMRQREEAMKSDYASKYIQKDRIQSDPLGALSELGLSYEQITEMVLNQGNRPDITKDPLVVQMQAEIKRLSELAEKSQKDQVEGQTKAYQQAVAQIKREASTLVFTDPAYETIKETGSVNDVVELIEATYRDEDRIMSVEEAAKLVEEHLIEEAMKLTKLKKIQERLKPVAPASQLQDPKQSQPSKTLTNAVGGSRKQTPRERALAAFKGELK